ncbi:HTH-type transcriptional activator Btr [Abditibacteriota bacterium]|nr:HTH-type transcriptional activator Btr [Abditibacteriota bacterium]
MSEAGTVRVRVTERPNVATYPQGATFGPREAVSWEFVWLLEGHATYRFEGAKEQGEIELRVGQLLLCRPDERDWFEWDREGRTRHGFFHFHLESPSENSSHWPRVRATTDDDLFGPLARHLLTWSEIGDGQQRDLAASLFLSAFISGQSSLGDVPPQRAPEPVERAMQWLYARLEDDASAPISLDALSRAAFVSPEHLCRLFKNTTDHSPLEVVRLARLDRAALLLARTNFAIGEIAHLTGFASQFHFSRAFKEAYGSSPRELRKKLERGEAMPLPRLLRKWRP